MNEIQQFRVEVLEEAARRMRYNDWDDMPFADTDTLVSLLRQKADWEKKLKPTKILSLISDSQKKEMAEYENKIIESDNKKIEKYIKPLEFKIKILEVEMILFNGIFEMGDLDESIHKRVYPDMDDEDE
jgi:hypothetical protein